MSRLLALLVMLSGTLYANIASVPMDCQAAAISDASTRNHEDFDLLREYSARFGKLLRDFEADMRLLAERAASGELDSGIADTLRLSATRRFVARLETLSAVYDRVIVCKKLKQSTPIPAQDGTERINPTALVLGPSDLVVDVQQLRKPSND